MSVAALSVWMPADMAAANRTCGEERIASELLLKSGIRVSPRTVRRYMRRECACGRHAVAAVEHVRAQSHQCRSGVRFLCDDLGDVPRVLHRWRL